MEQKPGDKTITKEKRIEEGKDGRREEGRGGRRKGGKKGRERRAIQLSALS